MLLLINVHFYLKMEGSKGLYLVTAAVLLYFCIFNTTPEGPLSMTLTPPPQKAAPSSVTSSRSICSLVYPEFKSFQKYTAL